MAEFAIGSIANMATRNPKSASFQGNLTHLGQTLDPHWESAIPLFAVITTAHSVIFILAVYISKRVVIKDGSMLAIARLLRPLVEVLGDTGTYMSGENLSREVAKSERFKEGVIYGPQRHTGLGEYYLDLAKDVKAVNEWPNRNHPNGTYR